MTPLDRVLVALSTDAYTPGRCRACNADITHRAPQARWCEACFEIRDRVARRNASYRWRVKERRETRCTDCGRWYKPRKGPATRCRKCQDSYRRAYDRARRAA